MRCNWRRWLWGLIPLIMVSWVAVLVERGRIEDDLSQRAKQALAEDESGWASVTFKGRDANLSGRALMENQPVSAEQAVRKVWGVRDVDNNAALPPKIEPFQWSARRRGNRVRLLGYVPGRPARRTIMGMANAALPGVDVSDKMNTARGAPNTDAWLAGLNFALKQLALLKRGDVRMEDLSLSISGEAEDAEAYRTLNAALKPAALPKGITLGSVQITAPVASPFVWSAQFAGDQMILSGHVPDSARANLLATAKAIRPSTTVVDRMEVAEGAPADWANAAAAVVTGLMRLQSGEADMKDSAIVATGIAADEAAAQTARAALRTSMPGTFKLTHQITVREPPPPPPQPKAEAQPPKEETLPAKSAAAPTPAPAPQPMFPREPPPKDAPPAPFVPFPSLGLEPPPGIPPAAELQPPPPPRAPEPSPSKAEMAPSPAPPPQAAAPSAPAKEAPAPAVQPALPQANPAPPQAVAAVPPPPKPTPEPTASAPAAQPEAKAALAPPPAAKSVPAPDACGSELAKVDTSGHILFDTDSAKLDASSHDLLDRLASAARSCNGLRIAIEGHTDTEGSARYNKRLSVRRAQAVERYLVKAGMNSRQLEAIGYGYDRPAAPNDSAENMAKNRRIEFVIRRH
jgi:outer membrane protein OmpA-like peptidoglycan-associated protein